MASIPRTSDVFVNAHYAELERRRELEKLKSMVQDLLRQNKRLEELLQAERVIKDYIDPKLLKETG